MKKAFDVLLCLLAVFVVPAISQTTADPMVGTWKVSAEKSKVKDKDAVFTEFTVTAVSGKPHTYHFKYIFSNGKTIEQDRIYDGKERTNPDLGGRLESYEVTGLLTHRNTYKSAGEPTQVVEATISSDGKTWSSQRKAISADGKVTDGELIVSDKQ